MFPAHFSHAASTVHLKIDVKGNCYGSLNGAASSSCLGTSLHVSELKVPTHPAPGCKEQMSSNQEGMKAKWG